jgi:hypothetical protein
MPEARARRRASLPASNRFFLRFFTKLPRKSHFSHAEHCDVNQVLRFQNRMVSLWFD